MLILWKVYVDSSPMTKLIIVIVALDTWYCPTCRTLLPNKLGKGKAKEYENSTAMGRSSICICNNKAAPTDRLLGYKAGGSSHGKSFYLRCLGCKRRSNSTKCNCKMSINVREQFLTPDIVSAQSTLVPSVAN